MIEVKAPVPDLEKIERELVKQREFAFLEGKIYAYRREHGVDLPTAFREIRRLHSDELPDLRPPAGLSVIRWDTGYIAFDMEAAQKLPKRQLNKILNAGKKPARK